MSAHDASARKSPSDIDARIDETTGHDTVATTVRVASTETKPLNSGVRHAAGLQAYLREQVEPREADNDQTANTSPVVTPRKSRVAQRVIKSLIGLTLVAIVGWMPAQRLLQVSSIEAVMNATLVTVRAPIDGIVTASGTPLSVGNPIPAGIALASVDNQRADRRGLDEAEAELEATREDRAALAARLRDLKSQRASLADQLVSFRENRLLQLDARIDEADARIAATLAIAAGAESARGRQTTLRGQGVASATALDDIRREVAIANAGVDEARAARAALAVEKRALQSGIFFGDSYNDQPRSAQRLDEIDRQIAAVEADLGREDGHIRRAEAALTRERDAFALVQSANLVAPTSGRIWEVLTAPGEHVVAGQPLFSLIDCAHPMVTAVVSEAVFNTLSIGMPAEFVYREGGEALTGHVAQLSGVAVASSNLAIMASALQKESYRVAIALDTAPASTACPVGRTGRVVFDKQGR